MNYQEQRNVLRKHLINYLSTSEEKRCHRDKIWEEMSHYLKKSLSRKMYGVVKMHDLLEYFGDVIILKEDYIYLKSSITNMKENKTQNQMLKHCTQTELQPSANVESFQTNPKPQLEKTSTSRGTSVNRSTLPEPLYNESLGLEIEDDFPSLQTSKALVKTSDKKTRNEKQLSLKHQKPNIQKASPDSSVDSWTVPSMSHSPTNVHDHGAAEWSDKPLWTEQAPGTKLNIKEQQSLKHQKSKIQTVSPDSSVDSWTVPTMSHSSVSVHDYGVAEWPDMPQRTGRNPGTKLNIKPISVPAISLTKGARLTDAEVNQQIKFCIETLSTAKVHVTLKEVENLLLQMYKVKKFDQLNLPEKIFNNMPAAKEHQMLFSKVLVYIQTFVRSRSLCTLYELEESLREFHPQRKSFDHLKLGPLQKIPSVWTYFKFPSDEIIPEITSVDVIEHLFNFLNKYDKWTEKTSISDFMKYLADVYEVDQPFSLGIRVGSLPLAIQMLKKSQRDVSEARRKLREGLKLRLCQDIEEAVQRFHDSLLRTDESCGQTLRLHYLKLSPENTIQEIFQKFEVLIAIITDETKHTNQSKAKRLLKDINQFVTV